MQLQEVMSQLKSLGTEQTRKTYRRHGSGDNVFGVSFADLYKIAKKIKCNHELACQLWETQNIDAQSLATMIFDPKKLDEKTSAKWIGSLDYYALGMLFSGCLAKSTFSRKVIDEWTESDNQYLCQAGYDTLAQILKSENDLSDQVCKKHLEKIESEISTAPNRVRYSMNGALIAIGVYKPNLTESVLKSADRIGKVEVDHGDTSCKTPDARAYIMKALSRKSRTKARVPSC